VRNAILRSVTSAVRNSWFGQGFHVFFEVTTQRIMPTLQTAQITETDAKTYNLGGFMPN